MTRLERAARALLDDVHRRYPGEELRCPFMRELEAAVSESSAIKPVSAANKRPVVVKKSALKRKHYARKDR